MDYSDSPIQRITLLVKKYRKTPTGFAKMVGIDPAGFIRMMRGEITVTDKSLQRIATACGVSFQWLLSGDDQSLPDTPIPTTSQSGDSNNYQQGEGNVYNSDQSYKVLLELIESNNQTSSDFIAIVKKAQEQIDRLISLLENKQ